MKSSEEINLPQQILFDNKNLILNYTNISISFVNIEISFKEIVFEFLIYVDSGAFLQILVIYNFIIKFFYMFFKELLFDYGRRDF